MSQLTQHGQHPDADQLTAFVEQALPPHEREQTLAHLATCADCRAIVALSLPPLDESPAPQPEPAGRPSFSGWFTGWHLAWPAAAACAALAFVIIHLHNTAATRNNIAPPTQIATSHPSALLSVQPQTPASTPKQLSSPTDKPQPANQPASVDSKARNPEDIVKNESLDNLQIANRNDTADISLQAARAAGVANKQQATGSAAPAAPQTQPAILGGTATAAAPAPPATSKARVATVSPQSVAGSTINFTANSKISSTPTVINGLNPALSTTNLPAAAPLPSHLPAISTATNGHQVLAIDNQNTLFYSEDEGKHWTPVPSQWQGRAVRVNLARPTMSLQQITTITTASYGATGGPVPSSTPTAAPSVTGTITDASGAAIPNTSITISNPTTQTTRTATSDRNGHYLVDNLTPGTYQLQATAPGFQKQQLAVNVTASQQNQANLTLPVGAASETVTVEGATQAMPLAAPRALKKSTPPKPPTPLFEITTDNNGHWTSPDGKVWRQK